MSDIYGCCSSDIVWMGQCTEEMAHMIHSLTRGERPWAASDVPDDWFHSMTPGEKFCSNPVFDRIWIVQEVALAPSVTIQFGHHIIPWEMFEAFLDQSGFVQYADAFHNSASHAQDRSVSIHAKKTPRRSWAASPAFPSSSPTAPSPANRASSSIQPLCCSNISAH